MILMRKAYDGLGDEVSFGTGFFTKPDAVSLTVQSQKDEADINTIVRRFGVTGLVPNSVRVPTFGDFTGVSDYRTALDSIKKANDSFMLMDAEVRKRFDHDPQKFVAFCSDSKNLDEMRAMGLAVPKKDPKAERDLERSIIERRMTLEREIAAELDARK